MATPIPQWREFVTIKAIVPKNKAIDGAGNAATVNRRTQIASVCWAIVKINIKATETKNDKRAKKNRSLNNIFASLFWKRWTETMLPQTNHLHMEGISQNRWCNPRREAAEKASERDSIVMNTMMVMTVLWSEQIILRTNKDLFFLSKTPSELWNGETLLYLNTAVQEAVCIEWKL